MEILKKRFSSSSGEIHEYQIAPKDENKKYKKEDLEVLQGGIEYAKVYFETVKKRYEDLKKSMGEQGDFVNDEILQLLIGFQYGLFGSGDITGGGQRRWIKSSMNSNFHLLNRFDEGEQYIVMQEKEDNLFMPPSDRYVSPHYYDTVIAPFEYLYTTNKFKEVLYEMDQKSRMANSACVILGDKTPKWIGGSKVYEN